jgi:hypothetical protein
MISMSELSAARSSSVCFCLPLPDAALAVCRPDLRGLVSSASSSYSEAESSTTAVEVDAFLFRDGFGFDGGVGGRAVAA